MATWTKQTTHDQITHYYLTGFDRWHVAVVTGRAYITETHGDIFIPMARLKAAKQRIEEKAQAA